MPAAQLLELRVAAAGGAQYAVRICATASAHDLLLAVAAVGCEIPLHLGQILRENRALERYAPLAAQSVCDGALLQIVERDMATAMSALMEDSSRALARHGDQLSLLRRLVDILLEEKTAAAAAKRRARVPKAKSAHAVAAEAAEAARRAQAFGTERERAVAEKCRSVLAATYPPAGSELSAAAVERGCLEILAEAKQSALHRKCLVETGAIERVAQLLQLGAGNAQASAAGLRAAAQLAIDQSTHEQLVQAGALDRACWCLHEFEGIDVAAQARALEFAQWMVVSEVGQAALRSSQFAVMARRVMAMHSDDPAVQASATVLLRAL